MRGDLEYSVVFVVRILNADSGVLLPTLAVVAAFALSSVVVVAAAAVMLQRRALAGELSISLY